MRRRLYVAEHELFRDTVRGFVERHIVPRFDEWDRAGIVDKEMFQAAAAQGLVGMAIPERYGGGGVPDFRFNAIIGEEIQYAAVAPAGFCITLHNDVVLPYFLHLANEEQRARWLPGMASGELMGAVAMTEPSMGSDLASMRTTAVRDGDHYVLSGQKTFISNGINADLVVVAAKTDPKERHAGISLFVVEEGMAGFRRGRNLEKVGMHAQDTAELFFDDVPVPAANLLGEEGKGFLHLVANLPQERLSIAVGAVAAAEAVFGWTLDYVKERHAFGSPVGSFQANKHRLAEMRTEIDLAWTFLDRAIEDHNAGSLTATDAAEVKWWTTELQKRVVDGCVQLHGGYGYMLEYPVARAYLDARVQTIYGGTTEIMKEIIGKSLGL